MKRYGKELLIAFCALWSVMVCGQQKNESVENIISKASQIFKTKDYLTYNVKYNIFSDYTTTKATETYTGFLLKKDNIFYYKIKNTEFVGFKDHSVKISNDEKALLIGKKGQEEFPLDLSTYLKAFKSRLIKSDNTSWTCELIPDKISQIMFSKVIMVINKKDYSVARQVLYFLNTSPDEKAGRLEISFTTRTKDLVKDKFLIEQSNYFTKSGNTIKTASRFKEYKLYKDQN